MMFSICVTQEKIEGKIKGMVIGQRGKKEKVVERLEEMKK